MEKVENHTVEFKQSWHDEYLKTIAAFANTEDGTIYIGYDDREEVVGLEKSETKKCWRIYQIKLEVNWE